MKKTALILIAVSLFLTMEAPADLACSIMDLGYKRYDTSLELTKSFNDYLVIISPDGKNWEYLQEHDGISCGHHFASLMLDGSDRAALISVPASGARAEKMLVDGILFIRRPNGDIYSTLGALVRRKDLD